MKRYRLLEKVKSVGVIETDNEDIRSLCDLITYDIKRLVAYKKHTNALLRDNDKLDAFMQSTLARCLMIAYPLTILLL